MGAIVDQLLWTPSGASQLALGDVNAKFFIRMEQIGGKSIEDVVPMFQAADVARFTRGNVSGPVVFTVAYSHDSRQDALAYFVAQYNLLNGQGTLAWVIDAATACAANANLTGVDAVEIAGLRWVIRYTFGITTLTCNVAGD